ncbi:hypothetical protein BASA81_004808 [Batrachochytrium salamandrivorans]|nr:hypothetical protein BASA81_004808 [Batrachochytrium salamandrivorans]
MRLAIRFGVRWLGNVGVLLFALYALHLAKRSFGPKRKVLSRQYRKSAITDFAPGKPPSLSKLPSEVSVSSEHRIHRSLTGVGSEEPTTTVARLALASQNMPNAAAFMDYSLSGESLVWEAKVTWGQYYARSFNIAASELLAKVNKHDVVLFVSESRPELFLAWMAVQMCGGICCSAHAWSSMDELKVVLQIVKPVLCFVDRDELLGDGLGVPVMSLADPGAFAAQLEKDQVNAQDVALLEKRIATIRPGHASQILFSSGQQTIQSKPYLLSHDNVTFSARAFLRHHENTSRWGGNGENEHVCSFLPLSHVGALVMDLHMPMCLTATTSYRTACTVWTLHKRTTIDSIAVPNLLFTSLKHIRPTLFLGMPAVWDRIHRALQKQMSTGPVVQLALDTGRQWFQAVQAGRHGTEPVWLYYAERYVLNSIKRQLGLDRCKLLMSSGAPIARKQLEFFGSLGLHVMEIFGATGCSGPQTMGRQDYFECGKVGVSLPSCELKLVPVAEYPGQGGEGDVGEICVRGRHVCMGVLNDAETTNRVIDSDGFFHTNHIGKLSRFGCLELVGRMDELVGGSKHKLGLNHIEAIVRDCARPLVDRVVVVSVDNANQLRVFMTLRQSPSPSHLPSADEVYHRIATAVSEANHVLRGVCEIEHFFLLPREVKFTSFGTGAELTHSGQARRSVVKLKYQNELRVLTSPGFSSKSQQ